MFGPDFGVKVSCEQQYADQRITDYACGADEPGERDNCGTDWTRT